MTDSSLLLYAILVPLLGSLLLPLIGRAHKLTRNLLAGFLVLVAVVANLALIPTVLLEGKPAVANLLGMRLVADGLAVFVASASSFLSLIIIIYSFDYIEQH